MVVSDNPTTIQPSETREGHSEPAIKGQPSVDRGEPTGHKSVPWGRLGQGPRYHQTLEPDTMQSAVYRMGCRGALEDTFFASAIAAMSQRVVREQAPGQVFRREHGAVTRVLSPSAASVPLRGHILAVTSLSNRHASCACCIRMRSRAELLCFLGVSCLLRVFTWPSYPRLHWV